MNYSQTLPFADRLALTLQGLARAVAARSGVGASWGSARGTLATVLILLVWTRVKRAEVRIQALLARFLAGRLRTVPVRRMVGAVRTERTKSGGAVKGVPQGLAWLLPLVPCEAANFASQLRVLLAEPEMAGLLAASAQARRILKPVCRMLGIEAEVLAPEAVVAVAAAGSAEGGVLPGGGAGVVSPVVSGLGPVPLPGPPWWSG